jgi:hypothetical protein
MTAFHSGRREVLRGLAYATSGLLAPAKASLAAIPSSPKDESAWEKIKAAYAPFATWI